MPPTMHGVFHRCSRCGEVLRLDDRHHCAPPRLGYALIALAVVAAWAGVWFVLHRLL